MRRRPKAPTETTVLPEQGGPVSADAPTESFWNQNLEADVAPGYTSHGSNPHGSTQQAAQPTAMPGGAPGSAAPGSAAPQHPVQPLQQPPLQPQDLTGAPLSAGPEYTVVRVRRHGRHLVWPVLVLMVVAWLTGFYVGTLPEAWMNIALGAGALVIALLLGVGPLLGWLTRRTIITTRRVIVHRGFFVRHRSEVSLMRVREVRSRQNLMQRMWGSGDVDLVVGTESTRVYDAPRVKDLHAALRELSEHSYDEQQRLGGFAY